MLKNAFASGRRDCLVKLGLYASFGTGDVPEPRKSDPLALTAFGTGAALTAPALAALYGGRAINTRLAPYDVFRPAGLEKARAMFNPPKGLSDAEFLHHYATRGADLVNSPVMDIKGAPVSGRDLVVKMRENPLAKKLEEKGLLRKFTPESAHHYEQFAQGPLKAYEQMTRETTENLRHHAGSDLLGARYEAIHGGRAGAVDAAAMREAFAQNLAKRTGGDIETARSLVDQLETRAFQADPAKYLEHMQRVREGGQDASHLQNELLHSAMGDINASGSAHTLSKMEEIAKGMGHTGPLHSLAPETQSAILREALESKDIASQLMRLRAGPSFRGALEEYARGMGPLASAGQAVKNVRAGGANLAKWGKRGLIGGGLLAGAGLGKMLYDRATED